MPQSPTILLLERLTPPRRITTTTYTLRPSDYQSEYLVLDAGAPTVVTVPSSSLTPGMTVNILDLVGGGSVVAGAGTTLIHPNGATFASAGSVGVILCPSHGVAVVAGDTVP